MTEQMSAFDSKRTFTTSVTCCPARVFRAFFDVGYRTTKTFAELYLYTT